MDQSRDPLMTSRTLLILGGGIAGISCLEAVIHEFRCGHRVFHKIVLISESRLIKKARNIQVRGRNLETFDITESDFTSVEDLNIPDDLVVNFVVGSVEHIDAATRTITVKKFEGSAESCQEYRYDCLSICIGAKPKTLTVPGASEPAIVKRTLTIRDVTSIKDFRSILTNCRRVAIIGDGGIALGLINKISGCEIVWIGRDDFMGYPFLDSEASKFLLDPIESGGDLKIPGVDPACSRGDLLELTGVRRLGPALGPDWLQQRPFRSISGTKGGLRVIQNCQVLNLEGWKSSGWPLTISLTNGQTVDCDLLVTAIGVEPNRLRVEHGDILTSHKDGAIVIDEQMRTSIGGVYAAGDVVSCERWSSNPLWFQMRLWTQARQMGHYCGRCIVSHLAGLDPTIYATFDCFTHVTELLGKKAVLLGRYNVRTMGNPDVSTDYEALLRVQEGREYVRLTLKSGVVIGALLLGDTHLDETIENLIHDAIDVSQFKDRLLDNTVDVQDFFD